jgi:CRP/FNR family transcriptional regulator, cyclic AMP receptor protein
MTVVDLFRFIPDAKSFPKGKSIFRRGERGDGMYVIVNGRVEISVGGRVLESMGAGAVFGEMALVDDSPRTASAVAKTDCAVLRIDSRRFQSLVQKTPDFALQIMAVMANRLRRMNRRVTKGARGRA